MCTLYLFSVAVFSDMSTEIKLIVLSLIARATPTLLEGRFEIADPLNTVRYHPPCLHAPPFATPLPHIHAYAGTRARR